MTRLASLRSKTSCFRRRTLAVYVGLAACGILLAACGILLAACGAGEPPFEDGRPALGLDTSGCDGKPGPGIGRVQARIIERPAPDRAVIEATWWRGPRNADLGVELRLPEDAWIVGGQLLRAPMPGVLKGTMRWEVGFATGRDLDAVIQLVGGTLHGRCATETYVRLASAEPR